MTCCPNNITPFVGATQTDVPYNDEFGESPIVSVLYFIDGFWQAAGVFTQIKLIGTPVNIVRVDHGGPSTGIIKLS